MHLLCLPTWYIYPTIGLAAFAVLFLVLWFRAAYKNETLRGEISREKLHSEHWRNSFYEYENTHSRLLTRLRENGVKVEELK